MSTQEGAGLTPAQQAMVETWEKHIASEFEEKSLEATLETMTAESYVNHAPVMTGGGFAAAGAAIAGLGAPPVLIQEGGYDCQTLGRNLMAFLAGFQG